jgi:hypothetical protein
VVGSNTGTLSIGLTEIIESLATVSVPEDAAAPLDTSRVTESVEILSTLPLTAQPLLRVTSTALPTSSFATAR